MRQQRGQPAGVESPAPATALLPGRLQASPVQTPARRPYNEVTPRCDRRVAKLQVFSQLGFPRRSTWGIRKEVGLPPDPDPEDVEALNFERPIGHLLRDPPIVKHALIERVVPMANVAQEPP